MEHYSSDSHVTCRGLAIGNIYEKQLKLRVRQGAEIYGVIYQMHTA